VATSESDEASIAIFLKRLERSEAVERLERLEPLERLEQACLYVSEAVEPFDKLRADFWNLWNGPQY
jgi:hypothetical protein